MCAHLYIYAHAHNMFEHVVCMLYKRCACMHVHHSIMMDMDDFLEPPPPPPSLKRTKKVKLPPIDSTEPDEIGK